MTKDIRLQSNLVACEELNHNTHATLRNRSYKIRNTRNLCFYSISHEGLNIDRKIFQVQAKTDIEKTLQNFRDNPKLDLQKTV
jgi:hypothetical protein